MILPKWDERRLGGKTESGSSLREYGGPIVSLSGCMRKDESLSGVGLGSWHRGHFGCWHRGHFSRTASIAERAALINSHL